ncbi:MAG: class I SAM-dependent methyltransferase [Myxococcota bacterium]|jgi:SAM-dependent methyltransferase|nr:class I SAM-dependent methyltransferase [Myxococcota bacterium]
MTPESERFWPIFLEVYTALPRQGPGNRAAAERALELLGLLSPLQRVLDLGCGVGAQTLYLSELLGIAPTQHASPASSQKQQGQTPALPSILAVDLYLENIERLQAAIEQRGLQSRVKAQVGDMSALELSPESFDLLWSEGALYSIGLAPALETCFELLRPGGALVFTDAVWRKPEPPEAVRASFDFDYPTMGTVQDDLRLIEEAGFELVGHFTLPDEAWWEDFYTPMEARVAVLRQKYVDDPEALEILAQVQAEVDMHRAYSEYYAYEYFIAIKPDGAKLRVG